MRHRHPGPDDGRQPHPGQHSIKPPHYADNRDDILYDGLPSVTSLHPTELETVLTSGEFPARTTLR